MNRMGRVKLSQLLDKQRPTFLFFLFLFLLFLLVLVLFFIVIILLAFYLGVFIPVKRRVVSFVLPDIIDRLS
jgi:hypothetical protein